MHRGLSRTAAFLVVLEMETLGALCGSMPQKRFQLPNNGGRGHVARYKQCCVVSGITPFKGATIHYYPCSSKLAQHLEYEQDSRTCG